MVGLYFNTRNMSAILKALQNRKIEVELKSEVVEFGIGDDIKKGAKTASSLVSKAEKARDKMEKLFNSYNSQWEIVNTLKKEADSEFKRLENLSKKAEDAAKELGVKPSGIDGYSQIESSLKDLFAASNSLNSYPAVR